MISFIGIESLDQSMVGSGLSSGAYTIQDVTIEMEKQGRSNEAIGYFNQAIDLESDSYEKSNILFRIATNFR